jgi:acetyl esterase/lipase
MSIDIRRGIEYARHDGIAPVGDLYAPGGVGKFPVLVAVHGGGWQLGTRDSYRFGTAPTEDRRRYFDASPLSYVTSDNNATALLLSWGTEDDIVDRATQSEAFLTALKQAGFYARTVVMQGAGHFWMSDPIEAPTSITGHLAPRLVRFLAEKV